MNAVVAVNKGAQTVVRTAERDKWGSDVLVGLSAYLVRRLQSVLKAAAQLIYCMRSADHITDALACLHWLRVLERIDYKVTVVTYKVLYGSASGYLGSLVAVADLLSRRTLPSSDGAICQTFYSR